MNQQMVKETGETAAILDLTVGLMDLKARKLIEPTKEWLEAIGHV